MMTQRNTRKSSVAILALSLAAWVPCRIATASGKTVGSTGVERIETKNTGGKSRNVVIHTSKEPTFSVFRLSDPFRVLVDINDARLLSEIDLRRIDDGVLRYISTNVFSDESSSIVRVEIATGTECTYEVHAQGSSIVVEIGIAKGQLAPESPPALEPTASTSAKFPPEKFSPAKLGRLTRKVERNRTLLVGKIEQGGLSPEAVEIEHLEGPSRLVVDLAGVSVEPKWQNLEVKRFGVHRARVGAQDTGTRIVLDLKDGGALPSVDVRETNGRLEIALAAPVKPAAASAPAHASAPVAAPAPASARVATPEPAPVATPAPALGMAPATAPAPPIVASPPRKTPAAAAGAVTDIQFEPREGFVRLTVVVSDETLAAKRDPAGSEESPILRIPQARLPSSLERTLDVTAVSGGAVTAISSFREGDDTVLAASVAKGAEHRHWKKGNRIMWDFRLPESHGASGSHAAMESPDTPHVLSYPEQATASYPASAATRAASTLLVAKTGYSGRRISLDLKDAEIQNVLRLLADVSKLNVVAADDVKGRVTIKLRNVPWDQALDIILRSKQLDKTRIGNIIRVAPLEVLRKEEELRLERRKAQVELEPLAVRLIPVSYAVASEIKPQVVALLSPRGKVNIDIRTNVLVIEDIAEMLSKIERLVRTLDTQTPQVLIEARIVEANSSFERSLGIQWGGNVSMTQQFGTSTGLGFPNNIRISGASDSATNVTEGVLSDPNYVVNLPSPAGAGAGGSLGFVFGSAGGAALMSLRLTAAESTGKVKIVSAPKIVTIDNKEAKILSGEKIPITVITANGPSTRFIDANLELGVTPHVTQDGSVLLSIKATKNEISDRRDLLGTPGIITREANTEMLVRDGDTAVLGGIYKRNALETKAYVPWIGQIPVLGWLFKTTLRRDERQELLIFISPRIVNRAQALVSTNQ